MKLGLLPFSLALAAAACNTTDQFTPRDVIGLEPVAAVTAGGFHTCAVLENGNRACWGDDADGQIGVALEGELVTVPVFVPLDEDAIAMSAGALHTCAVLAGGGLACWGDNRDDQLGFASCEAGVFTCPAAPERVPGLEDVVAVAAGGPRTTEAQVGARGFTCAIRGDDTVHCWGHGPGGGPEPSQVTEPDGFPLRQIVHVTAGDSEACAIDAGGNLWCWTSIAGARRIDNLPPVIDASVGGGHTCVATRNGSVICWGSNLNGESGSPDSGLICADEDGECIVGPTVVPGVAGAVAVSAGQRHSCAVDEGGRVICWGSNQNGQIGVEVGGLALAPSLAGTAGKAVAVEVGAAHSCAVLEGGKLQCWGSDSRGQLGIGR
jgi:alpha-tubulin suppressor-like RCC1 family protein